MNSGHLLLAGDIGGTKTRLALFQTANGQRLQLADHTYVSAQYPGLEAMVLQFLEGAPARPVAACFGVAGPVNNGRCQTTNLPWLIEETSMAESIGIATVRLLNDLQAMALGLVNLPAAELAELNPNARPGVGNIAVIAAGTGLGEALLYWDGHQHHAIATEGGHADFAPNTPEQEGLLRWLRARFAGHVSYERIVSGPGIHAIYQYLLGLGDGLEAPQLREALRSDENPGKLIGQLARDRNDPLCSRTMRLFLEVYGAEAGNWALKTLAQGGVLIGGGIAAKNLDFMSDGTFMAAFRDKGRFSAWLGNLSVKVALNEDAGLLGAAQCAASLRER